MTVKELISLHDNKPFTQEGWSFSVYDMSGSVQFAYINNYYSIDQVHPAILSCEVKSFTLGLNSLNLRINPIVEAVYLTEEKLIMDGYVSLTNKWLWVKEKNGKYFFARKI